MVLRAGVHSPRAPEPSAPAPRAGPANTASGAEVTYVSVRYSWFSRHFGIKENELLSKGKILVKENQACGRSPLLCDLRHFPSVVGLVSPVP